MSCTLALTTSCNDFLDKAPDDQLTMEMIFTDKIRTEDWLAGVYSSIPSPMWGISRHKVITLWAMISLFPKIGRRMDGAMCMPTPPGTGVLSQNGPYYWVELHKRIRSGLIFLQEAKYFQEKT